MLEPCSQIFGSIQQADIEVLFQNIFRHPSLFCPFLSLPSALPGGQEGTASLGAHMKGSWALWGGAAAVGSLGKAVPGDGSAE